MNDTRIERLQKRLKLMKHLRELDRQEKAGANQVNWYDDQTVALYKPLKSKKLDILHESDLTEIQIRMLEDRTSKLIDQGYSVKQVADLLAISTIWVYKIIHARELMVIRPFKYRLNLADGHLLFSPSKQGILRYFALRGHHQYSYPLMNLKLENGIWYWYEVPIGSYYIVHHNGNYYLRTK